MHRVRHTYLKVGLLVGIVLASRSSEAQYTANYQTNTISGVTSNWAGDYVVGNNYIFDALLVTNSGALSSSGDSYIGYTVASSNNSVLVSGSGSVWTNSGDIYVGDDYGYGNSLVISNGGKVFNGDGYIGMNTYAASNSVLVTGSGSVWTNSTDLYVGWRASSNSLVISSGGTAFNSYGYIGNDTSSSNNNVLVTGIGSVWANFYNVRVGDSGGVDSLVISNGGRVVNQIGYIGYGVGANGNSVLVTGSSSVWTNSVGLQVGRSGSGNSLVISNGGTVVSGVGEISYIGYNSGANSNSVLVSGGGSAWTNSTELHVGDSSRGNSLAINNGGAVVSISGSIGYSSVANNNSVLVSGSGSAWTNSDFLSVGYNGSGNSLVISNGGTVVNTYSLIGYQSGGSNNSVLVSGSGSVWTNSSYVYVGDYGRGNSLVISNGGTVFNSYGYIGYDSGTNNSVLVTGIGSAWTNSRSLYVGYTGRGNSLVITNGGTVVSSNLFVGYNSSSSNNFITLSSGDLTVTNPAQSGGLDVRRGTLTMNSGTITADQFWATNGVNSIVIFNGGTLTVNNKLVTSNGVALWYGLGTNSNPTVTTSNLTLGCTLNVTDAGGFTNGTYTLFSYGGMLTYNGVTIGTAPSDHAYTIDTNTAGKVNLTVTVPPPVAVFTGDPTGGTAPLPVTFADTSTGNITNRFWDFGDLVTSNTTATTMSHTYAAGTYNVSLTVSGLGGTNTQTRLNYITALTPAQIEVSPPSYSFGALVTGTAAQITFVVTNTGGMAVSSGTAASSAPFSILSGSPFSIPGFGSTNVVVQFAPVTVGSFITNVIFATVNGGNSTNQVTGMGLTPAQIGVSPPSYSFGALVTGTAAQITFVVTNTGGMAVSSGTAASSAPFSILSGSPFSIPGFGSTNVVVQFAPVTVGSFITNVIFATVNGGNSTNQVTGTGLTPAQIGVNPTNYAFSAITTGTTATITFVVTNTGGMAVSSGTAASSAPFSILSGSPFSIPGFGSTNVVVQFAPVTVGSFITNVIFATVNGGNSTNQVTGTGLTPAHLGVSPPSYSFNVLVTGTTATITFTVTNTGGTAVSSGTATSSAPFSILSGTPFSIPGFGSTNVVVQFAPVTAGPFTTNVIFTTVNGGNSTNQVAGMGVTPAQIEVTPPNHNFGAITTGTTAQVIFTVNNNGGEAVTNGSATSSAPFSILSGTPFSIAGYWSNDVVVQFAPVTVGSFTTDVIFATANGGNSTNQVTGTGLTPAQIGVNPTNYAFSAITTGTTVQTTFTVTNTGGMAIISGTATSSAPFSILSGTPFSIPGFGSTNVVVRFAPVTAGVFTNNVIFVTANGGNSTNQVTGTGLTPAQIGVNPTNYAFSAITTGTTATITFTVTNSGGIAVTNGTATMITGGGPFSILSGTPFSIPGFGSTNVMVQFAPVTAGVFTNNVVFTTANGGVSTNQVTGTGLTLGNIFATPPSHSFGTLATGTTTQTTFVVTNSGGIAVTNGSASVSGPFSIVSGATFSMAGFGTTNVVVRFAPVTAGGFTNDVVFTTANGGAATNTVSGTGAIVPTASFSGSPTNGVAPLPVTFTDTSTGTITNRFWSFGDSSFSNTTAPSVSHTYNAAGTNTVMLIVSGPVGVSTNTRPSYIVAITPAHLVVGPASRNYGVVTVGQNSNQTFSVINTGQQTLTGSASVGSPFTIVSGSSYSVPENGTNIVTVGFSPVAAGMFSNTVIFASNGGDSTNTVSGTGLTPGSISVTPASHDFGTLAAGATAQTSFVVTNSGGTAISNGTASVGGPFSIVSGSPFSVAGFGSTNVMVRFAPVTAGSFTNSVAFATANGGTVTNTVSGTGTIALVAQFTGSPTNGMAPLVVAFSNESTGTITDVIWDFGDGGTSADTNPTHTYSNVATFSVSLTVTGPLGSNTLNRSGYITVGNPLAPVFTTGPTVTNALLQIDNLAVVVAGDTNVFIVGARDPGGNSLSYEWLFGDGAISGWLATNIASHAYTTNCGPYAASVIVSNGWTAISSNLTVAIACSMNITKIGVKLSFAKTNSDSCTLTAALDLGSSYNLTNKVVTVDVGGAQVPFTLDAKGKGKGVSSFGSCKLAPNKKIPGSWTLTVKLAKGTWREPWEAWRLTNENVGKPGRSVTMPVVVVIGTDAFAGEHAMVYTAKAGKSGSAK